MRGGFYKFVAILLTAAFCAVGANAAVKYVFLFIGDGMSVPQRMMTEEFSREVNGGGLYINSMPFQAITTTRAFDSFITDSAASGTAIACGTKTRNGRLGVDADGKKLVSVAEVARDSGKKVGIITSVTLNHATPAAFYAHNDNRGNAYEIALDMLESGFDFFGGGEREAEALRFALVDLLVLFGEILAPGASPTARTYHEHVFKLDAIVLQKEKRIVWTTFPKFFDAVPPKIVIAADEDLFAWQGREGGEIVQPVFEGHRPAQIPREQDDVFGRDFFAPILSDALKMSRPIFPENIHRLWLSAREVQVPDRINLHNAYSITNACRSVKQSAKIASRKDFRDASALLRRNGFIASSTLSPADRAAIRRTLRRLPWNIPERAEWRNIRRTARAVRRSW